MGLMNYNGWQYYSGPTALGAAAEGINDNFLKAYATIRGIKQQEKEMALKEQLQKLQMEELLRNRQKDDAFQAAIQSGVRPPMSETDALFAAAKNPESLSTTPQIPGRNVSSLTPEGEQQIQGLMSGGFDSNKAISAAMPYTSPKEFPAMLTAMKSIEMMPVELQMKLLDMNKTQSEIYKNMKPDKEKWTQGVEEQYDPKTKTTFGRDYVFNPETKNKEYTSGWRPIKGRESVRVDLNQGSTTQVEALARGVIDKTVDPNGISKRGGLQAAVWGRVKEIDPAFNIIHAGAGAAFEKNPGAMNTKALLNSIEPLLDNLTEAGRQLKDTGSPLLNKPMQWTQKNVLPDSMGGVEVSAYDNLRNDTIAEVERGLLNTGVLSDFKYRMAVENLHSAQTQKQREAAVKNIKLVIKTRLEALEAGPYKDRNQPSGNTRQEATPRFTIKKVK